jgi:hypothetical protein
MRLIMEKRSNDNERAGACAAERPARLADPEYPWAMQLRLEIEGHGADAPLPGDGAALVAFMSFAVSRGFGATHPLIALADRLHDVHHVRMGPLTTFYDGEIEDSEDAEKLELAWQPAGSLRESVHALVAAIDGDEVAQTLMRRAAADGLRDQAAALIPELCRAEAAGARVRLVYAL